MCYKVVSLGLITGRTPCILNWIIFNNKNLLETPVLEHEKLSTLLFCSLMEDQTLSVCLVQEQMQAMAQKYPAHNFSYEEGKITTLFLIFVLDLLTL